MIREVKMYGAACDGCGKEWRNDDQGFVAFTDQMSIELSIQNDDWHQEADGSTYCPECHYFNDEDELVLNKVKDQSCGYDQVIDQENFNGRPRVI